MAQRDALKAAKKEEEYKKQRNKVSNLVKRAKASYFEKLINANRDTASLWRAVNEITDKSKNKGNTTTHMWSPNIFNDHFIKLPQLIQKSANYTSYKCYEIPSQLKTFCQKRLDTTTSFSIPLLGVHEVGSIISRLPNKKTMGPDNLNASILKLALPYIVDSLTYVYNLCIEQNVFPTALKSAKVIPLPKSRDITDLNNFRPISLLSVVSKPLEKHIHKHLMKYMEHYNLFYPFQSGFRPYHSCHTALTRLLDTWLSAVNQSKITGTVFLDLKKAFDLVNHTILLQKLHIYVQHPSTVSFFRSYLENRTQYVYLNGIYSTEKMINCGVPQGSVLGPLLFCIFINDLPLHISNNNVNCDLFADDSSLHCSDKNIESVQFSLQQSINQVSSWCDQNHMALNPQKTKSMVLTSRQKHQRIPLTLKLEVNGNVIEQVHEHRVLGVIVDEELKWQSHINHISKQLARNLFLLNRLRHYVDIPTRKLFFEAHCLSRINYASTIWGNASEVHLKRINSLHRRAAKLILPDFSLTTSEKLAKLNILPLHKQLDYNKIILMFKVHINMAPPYLNEFIQKAPARYSSENYILPHVRIDLYKSSFAFFGPSIWNSLPLSLKRCQLVSQFKSKVRKFLLEQTGSS